MIPHGVEAFVGLDPIDLRWGFERLAGVVAEKLGRSARSGALFVFFGKRRSALKLIFFDGTGPCLFYKRLEATGITARSTAGSGCPNHVCVGVRTTWLSPLGAGFPS